MGKSLFPDMHTFTVDKEGVRKLLHGLNPHHKAEGPDHIPARFLKEFATELSPVMTLIFQASLQQGEIPDDWRQANIAPVFKKGDRSVAANYRPISLTSVCSKVLEHIIHSQIMKHLDTHQILTDQQHGFRKKRSCESQLILTVQDLASAIEMNRLMPFSSTSVKLLTRSVINASQSNCTIMEFEDTSWSGSKVSLPTDANELWLRVKHLLQLQLRPMSPKGQSWDPCCSSSI